MADKVVLNIPHPIPASTESFISLENLTPDDFNSRDAFIAEWSGGTYQWLNCQSSGGMMAYANFEEMKVALATPENYTRCPDCGQYNCACPDDEQDDTCHCGHPDCGAC